MLPAAVHYEGTAAHRTVEYATAAYGR
ncbi:hypothetical protein CT19431_MP130271 [Cupriavidus taiwanensis]|nr:hypothetical protein CT19431_MP130271 [Cupriavidus taiwanensis]